MDGHTCETAEPGEERYMNFTDWSLHHFDFVSQLLLEMTDISFSESIDRLKESLLWAAAQGGNAQDCESLIQYGADVNWKNADGDTPLLAACRRGHAETIELLLACGADSNVRGIDSLTPLHIATRRGDAESVNILLNANTSTTLTTKDGQTALDIARAKGFESIYTRLMEKRNVARHPTAPSVITTSNSLINNVRNEVPSVLVNSRSESVATAGAGAESIAPASRQLQSLSRLIQQAKTDYSDKRSTNEATLAAEPSVSSSGGSGSAARRRRHPTTTGVTSVSSSVDSTGSGRAAWAGTEADAKVDSEGAHRDRSTDQDVKMEQQQKERTGTTKSSASSVPASQKSGNGNSYSLMGSGSSSASATLLVNNHILKNGHSGSTGAEDPAIVALRKILDQEKAARKALEMKLTVFKDQNSQLLQEFASLSQQLGEAQEEYGLLEHHLNRLLGEPVALETVTIDECEELEKSLKTALERIEAKKAVLIRNQIGNQKEQRMCVVCQEHEKSVVLLPCRHLCVCDVCSTHNLLKMCPLCREPIAHKISVFS